MTIQQALAELREQLDCAFHWDTAQPGTIRMAPSAGHCAAVAALIQVRMGGLPVSATVHGQSHWFNRVPFDDQLYDVDLTGDQFGLEKVAIRAPDHLFPNTRLRDMASLNDETLGRAILLGRRARLWEEAEVLQTQLDAKTALRQITASTTGLLS